MKPDYLPIPEIFVSVVFIPHEDCTPFHDGGGLAPPLVSARGGGDTLGAPLVGVRGQRPRREKLSTCLVLVGIQE